MALSLSETLRRTFHLAALRREMDVLRTGRQREAARRLMHRCEDLRQREIRRFRDLYDTRVERARRRIIDRAGARHRDLTPAFAGEDRFSPADTLRLAQRDVRAAHERRLARIDEIETRGLETLMRGALRQTTLRGTVRADFKRASNRRSGQDRRRGPTR
ncbi:hypothetical protein LC092_03280 [Stappia stellulata]|uniref:hypothetical protein n=1 Tax=Stappia stellulata TaxID=71235 RepID=UPI001CD4FCEA|nr:hypothetical protein [Stappia stellulata]MCA1241455.1 hypothetical protein [Stappia stellulata]